MTDRELMHMALDALGLFASDESDDGQMAIAAYVALRDRLAQPDREWVGLSEYQRVRFADRYHISLEGVEAIEAKLKEKNYGV
jgi:hypothetical protein